MDLAGEGFGQEFGGHDAREETGAGTWGQRLWVWGGMWFKVNYRHLHGGRPASGGKQILGKHGADQGFLSSHPQHTRILTSDLVQHQVQAAAKGGIETHGHRNRHVAEGLGQAAAVDIILCQDIWRPGLWRGYRWGS